MNNNVVYMHKNKINGKVYIGQTCNLDKRWHSSSYIGCTYFYNAIQKYGWNNFEHIILKNNLTSKEADNLEIKYIAKYKSTNSQFGYNLSEGGSNKCVLKGINNGFYGKHHTEKSLKIMKEKKYGGNNPYCKTSKMLKYKSNFSIL